MVEIIGRSAWGARAPKRVNTVPASMRTEFVIHHSGGPADQTVRAIQDWCVDHRGFTDIDYNFLVRGTTGQVYAGRGWDVIGAHTVGHNTSGIGVCVIGMDELADEAKASVRWLYAEAVRRAGHALHVYGHRDLDQTDCPGPVIYRWLKSGDVSRETSADFRELSFTDPMMHGEDVRLVQLKVKTKADGWFGKATRAAVIAWQKAHGLAGDGVVGPLTRSRMGLHS